MSEARASQPALARVVPRSSIDGAATGIVLAHIGATAKPLLWVQDRVSRREAGRPFLAGFPAPLNIIHVQVGNATDVLWTMEQGLGCPGLGGVIGEIRGDPARRDFTATKRLALRAEAHGVPAWLIRRAATASLSAARLRWRIAALPAAADPHDQRAPGQAMWRADLIRQRPGTAKGVCFIAIEDELGVANLVVWPKVMEQYRKVVMQSRLLAIKGYVQRDVEIIHVIASHLTDRTDALLRRFPEGLKPPLAPTDEVERPITPPRGSHPRDVRIIPKSRNFH